MSDTLKTFFLPKSKLKQMLAGRIRTALQDVKDGISALGELKEGDPVRLEIFSDAVSINQRIKEQEQDGQENPGAAYAAMKEICADAKAFSIDAPGRVKQQKTVIADAGLSFDKTIALIESKLQAVRKARAQMPNQDAAGKIQTEIERIESSLDRLIGDARGYQGQIERFRDRAQGVSDEVDQLLIRANQDKDLPGEDNSPRKKSFETMGAVKGLKDLGDRFESTQRDGRGRSVQEDAAMRLQMFDDHFALDESTSNDPMAKSKNEAMRLAGTLGPLAAKTSKDFNDPHMEGRIGQMLVREYGGELTHTLAGGQPDKKEQAATLKIAQALLMDDPLGKLMTGKIRLEDAVQRIRDQAAVAGLDNPSEMMALLRQQFEMKIGTLTSKELQDGTKKQDTLGNGASVEFVLSDLQGEMTSDKAKGMVEFGERKQRSGLSSKTSPIQDDGGLVFKALKVTHRCKQDETLADVAQAVLGDGSRAGEVAAMNEQLLAELRKKQNITDNSAPDLKGVTLTVTLDDSLMDRVGKLVGAWDGGDAPDQPDVLGGKAPQQPGNPTISEEEIQQQKERAASLRPTEEQLREGASKLKSPGDTRREGLPNYIQAPGLPQNHQVRAPLDGTGEKAPDITKPEGEKPPSTGAINERQYAHLRMLQRGDEEDKENIEEQIGMSVEDFVIDFVAKRHSLDKGKVKQLIADAGAWFGKVPLTITFNAEDMFKDPDKDGPQHGAQYKSDVELTRGKVGAKDLVGRDNNLKTKKSAQKLDKNGKPIEDEDEDDDEREKEEEKVGQTGGNAKNQGWKKVRGENYQRWRRDKDSREGRLDEMAYEDQQLFGAVNPNFDTVHGQDDKTGVVGTNYYGSAHFLLRDTVRQRTAFAVRGAGISIGGGKSSVQRTDLIMMMYDMIKGNETNIKYLDALLLNTKGSTTTVATGLDWEVHLYGGFDMRTDAQEVWLSPTLEDGVKTRLENFASGKFDVKFYSGVPTGIKVLCNKTPDKLTVELSA